ncbi:hypothetical protein Ocin01_04232 [Orchesella cincta]|uniref:Uncharacterized protein n=1 Tax=Orchesella cincta TaxID=48709 RepID=A0A1D2NBL4_ORCCI|nr:hypothetical protein Ocin01_04232 [Orchesella cincta]
MESGYRTELPRSPCHLPTMRPEENYIIR